jgi:N-acetylglutamate synthase-like GNAT family acetyltransferase
MLTIRKASSNDFQTIIHIMQVSSTEDELKGFVPPEGISKEFLKKLVEDLANPNDGVILAEDRTISVGFAYFHSKGDFMEIEEMDVAKKYQSRGAGKALLRYIERIAKEKGIKQLITGTSINKLGETWKAYGFWIHMGFVDTGKRIQGLHGIEYVKLVKQL